ncbi:MAG: hypothetical protein M3O03_03430 [Pseudomonadota bacterium]|nr:hypothetical protein [Pseudomonadota bacterium]
MMKFKTTALASTAILGSFWATAAFGADAVPAPRPNKNNTLSLEFSPEWKTSDSSLADDYLKFGYAHTFDNNIVWGAAFQYAWRPDSTSGDQLETSLGYKFKAGSFTFTPSALVGYGFGDHPNINHLAKTESDAYYAFALAADLKIDDHWTWNALNARYRNAFNTTWITPKVSTGITYKFDSANAIYANVGYAWKDAGDGKGLLGDKWNVAVGYKYSF